MKHYDRKNDPVLMKRHLYDRSGEYKAFKDIDKNVMKRVRDKIKILDFNRLGCYIDTLKYLTNPSIHTEFPTYDERIFFLIQSVDPDLFMYKEFVSAGVISKAKIENASDFEEKEFLSNIRRNQLNDYISKVRNKMGFFDYKLLSYETDLCRFLYKDKLNSSIKIDYIEKLFNKSNLINSFNNIDNDRLEKLNIISRQWYEKANNPKDYNTLAYNILTKSKALELDSYEEQLLLFIIVADPNLKLLDIYEEESKYNMIKKRSLVELGFYNKKLISLEKKYHERFYPEKKIKKFEKK